MASLETSCDPAPSKCGQPQTVMARRRAGKVNLLIEQGATFDFPFTYKEDDQPVDLTGVKIKSQFRRRIDDDAVIFDLTSEPNGGITIEPLEGKIKLTINADLSEGLTVYKGVWDMLVTFPDNTKLRILQGEFEVSRGVTRG